MLKLLCQKKYEILYVNLKFSIAIVSEDVLLTCSHTSLVHKTTIKVIPKMLKYFDEKVQQRQLSVENLLIMTSISIIF